ncbi:MAG: preprotein translocase subunit SecG [Planctomycetes bacterium GWF2_41_51]|nr:MAG: preprotein translocase subunit SecG [Planctomycetes bacterium GWF2_41_51]HBG26128.1 preprotein translocase subunit SecG [Phycisphaerales bacterium]
MMNLTLAAVPFVMKIVVVLWAIAALVLILVVLIQKGRGGGLASAFGGIGGSLLGTKTGDVLTWFTICLVTVWLILSVVAVKWYKPQASEFLQPQPQQQQLPATTPGSVPPPATQEQTEQPATPAQPEESEQTETIPQPDAPANQ